MKIAASELILNPDGSVYHLNLLPHQISTEIITVGDPDRVDSITQHFDTIEYSVHKREFKTVTGTYKGKRLTVLSTGIGTDNIDIVFNELDALVNIDLHTREIKEKHTALNIYRIGTSGAIRSDIDIDSVIISEHAIGLDGLMHYYIINENKTQLYLKEKATTIIQNELPNVVPYVSSASATLIHKYQSLGRNGITITATGFYGPQGRSLRLKNTSSHFIDYISLLELNDLKATNLEMETAGIYGLAEVLGHHAISFNAILANRANGTFSSDPNKTVQQLILQFLEAWIKA